MNLKEIVKLVFKRMNRVGDGIADVKLNQHGITFRHYELDRGDEVIRTYLISVVDITNTKAGMIGQTGNRSGGEATTSYKR